MRFVLFIKRHYYLVNSKWHLTYGSSAYSYTLDEMVILRYSNENVLMLEYIYSLTKSRTKKKIITTSLFNKQ